MKIDPAWFAVVGDLFVNLSAGWFAAALIVPLSGDGPKATNRWVLMMDIVFGILFLVLAHTLIIIHAEQ